MIPVYQHIEFCQDAATLWGKLEEGRWDWLGVHPDGQFVLGSPRRAVGGLKVTGAEVSKPGAKRRGFGFTTTVPGSGESGDWFTDPGEARAAYLAAVKAAEAEAGTPSIRRFTLWIDREFVESSFVVNRPSTYR